MKLRTISTILLFTFSLSMRGQDIAQSDWWNAPYHEFEKSGDIQSLARISVHKNTFVNPQGDVVSFKGLSISDPDKLEKQGHWNLQHLKNVKAMGANIVRIPVHPIAWRERTPEKYLELLDQAVAWATELGMYVIIDWHSIGNLGMELFQHPMYKTSKTETYEFWRTIAQRYAGNTTIAFYELFNEPTTYRGELGSMSWSEWKGIVENIIRLIRAFDPDAIPLVAGFDWAYDLTPLLVAPIDAEGIGYVTHPYAFKRSQPWEPKWEENFGFAASKWPVFATEFGIYLEDGEEISADHYGNRILNYFESKGMSWVCWVYDPEWHPQMLKNWEYDLTRSGEFFREKMKKEER